MSSLSEKISLLTNLTPAYLDPEEDDGFNIETGSKIRNISQKEDVLFPASKLRSKTLLKRSDPAYVGKKVSQKSLEDSNDNESDDDWEDEEQNEDDDDLEHFKASLAKRVHSDEENKSDAESMESAVSEDDEDDEDDIDEDIEDTEDMVNQFSHFDVSSEMEKGAAVKEQLEIINKLCEARIRLHKLLTVSHTFPQNNCWDAAKSNGTEMAESMNKASAAAENVLNSCLDFQLEYFTRVSENQENETLSDEEIPSDTDEEMPKSDHTAVKKTQKCTKLPKRKLKSHEYAEILSKHLIELLPYRNSVLQTWDEKTKLSSGKLTQKSFSAFENSVVKQIEMVLQDKDRLVKRTQLKRSMYRVMGKPDVSQIQTEDTQDSVPVSKQDMLLKDYDPEIFDDDDFYRQFLRDVIESKSVGIDPVSLRKQMEIQNVRNKIKKKVDTKASKGRKIRYDVEPKLVGFAVGERSVSDEARENILRSLCGGSMFVPVEN